MIEAVRRPATRLQEGLSGGGVEMDAEGFTRPGYNATGGASGAMRRRRFSLMGHQRDTPTALISQAIEILYF
jgi:hypothetical protein